MTNVLCSDGKRRVVWTGYPDTFFTIPARTQAFGRTVTGYVTTGEDDDGNECHIFRATGKHSEIFAG
jgi:hypothetical protein